MVHFDSMENRFEQNTELFLTFFLLEVHYDLDNSNIARGSQWMNVGVQAMPMQTKRKYDR